MASGIGGAAFLKNLPAEGSYAVNEPLFDRETERNDVGLPSHPFTLGSSNPIDVRIPNVGILGSVRLVLDGTMVVAGTVTSGHQFPHNLFKRITLNANGQTSLISAEGMDFRARRQRVWRNPREEIQTCPATDARGDALPGVIAPGTYPIKIVTDIPIVHDDESLAGALFAQSDQNYLSFRIQPGALGELFTIAGGASVTLTGTITPTLTYYDIPLVNANGRDTILIPDLRWLHGFLSNDKPFSNTGEVKNELIRSSGQLLAFLFRLDNGPLAQIAIKALQELRWVYGTNRKPRVLSPTALLEKNQRDYDGLLNPNYGCFDFEIDKPSRDLVYPKGLTELALEMQVPTGTTLAPNAQIHTVMDTLYMGV